MILPKESELGLRELKEIHADIDILVLTTEELETRKKHPSSLAHKVLTKGIKLYDAA